MIGRKEEVWQVDHILLSTTNKFDRKGEADDSTGQIVNDNHRVAELIEGDLSTRPTKEGREEKPDEA